MQRTISFAAAAAFFLTALPAAADPPTPVTPTPVTPTPGIVAPAPAAVEPTDTTTTTSADSAVPDTTAGPTTTEAPSTDTVTVNRSFRPNLPWLITGGAILVGSYATTAAITMSSGRDVKDRNLLIPVAGPWLNLANRQCSGCQDETRNVALVIGSGVIQGVGAFMAAASFFIPEKVAAATIQAGPLKMNIMPTSVGSRGDGVGLGTVGVF